MAFPPPKRVKDDVIYGGVTKFDFEIFGLADWRLSREDDKLYAPTKEWREDLQLCFAYNSATLPLKNKQFGGTAIFSIHKTPHLVISKGQDESKFGRWCRTRYRGKHDHTLRIMTHTAQIHRVVLSPCMLDIVGVSTVLMMTDAPVLCFFRIYAKT